MFAWPWDMEAQPYKLLPSRAPKWRCFYSAVNGLWGEVKVLKNGWTDRQRAVQAKDLKSNRKKDERKGGRVVILTQLGAAAATAATFV